MENVNNLKFQYLVELSKQGDRCLAYRDQVTAHLVENDVVFGKTPIPFLLMPHFLSTVQLEKIAKVVDHLAAVLEKFIATYLREPHYRELLRISEVEDALFRLDPGYETAISIARLDAFLTQDEVKFLEFNCDSPAGIGYADNLYDGLSKALDLPDVHYEFEEGYIRMLPSLSAGLLEAYASFRSRGRAAAFPEKPTVAIVDFDCVTASEFRIVRRHLESLGIRTLIGDPRHVQLDANGWPTLEGERVHLFYRRALVRDIVKRQHELPAFLEAARAHRACIANSFRGVLAGNKKVMALLLNQAWQKQCLTEVEREVVNNTVPWTRIVREEKTHYGGWTMNLADFIADNRARLVMKPARGYAGQGVYLGRDTEQGVWDRVLADALADPDEGWVVQEFIPVPEEMFPVIENGHLAVKLKKFNINPFCLRGRFAGIITRISDNPVINVTANGGLLPCCTAEPRHHLFSRRTRNEGNTA